jgi:hypothetical protein
VFTVHEIKCADIHALCPEQSAQLTELSWYPADRSLAQEFGKAVQAFVRLLVETIPQQVPVGCDGEKLVADQAPVTTRTRGAVPFAQFRHPLETTLAGHHDVTHASPKRPVDHGEVGHAA